MTKLTVLMFDLGLTLNGGDFSLLLKKPAMICVALFGQIVVLPLVAFLVGAAQTHRRSAAQFYSPVLQR